MTRLTATERAALQGILDSDFMDGMTGDNAIGHPVWTWSANPFPDKRTFSGAVGSLAKKGYVVTSGHGREDVIHITATGMAAFLQPDQYATRS